jgi:hypothetical protein
MLTLGTAYQVHDALGRNWGSVCFDLADEDTISGHLQPAPEFAAVRGLFQRFGSADTNAVHRASIAMDIVALGVTLTSVNDGSTHTPKPPVFVSEDLVFTCNNDPGAE